MSVMKFSAKAKGGFNFESNLQVASPDRNQKYPWTKSAPEMMSLEQARIILGEAGWSDLKFLAFCHGSVFIALPAEEVIWIRLKDEDYDQLLEILTKRDQERAALANLIDGHSKALAA